MTTVETSLPSGPGASRVARASLRETLRSWNLDRLGDVVALLGSELVSNAVLHVAQPSMLRVARDSACVRVEVDDVSPAPPILEHPDAAAVHGRGILLIAAMADDWGYELRDGGKTVWFRLDIPVLLVAVHRNGSS